MEQKTCFGSSNGHQFGFPQALRHRAQNRCGAIGSSRSKTSNDLDPNNSGCKNMEKVEYIHNICICYGHNRFSVDAEPNLEN